MLYSKDPCVGQSKRPVFTAWFGNFFEPYFSDFKESERGLEDLKEMGVNSIFLDSKLWVDFTEFFRSGKESPYVRMQNFIVDRCREKGLGVSFLALFNCGDNLYPTIRDDAPEFVEQPVGFNGKPLRAYRHWSKAQTREMVRHCLELYQHVSKDMSAKAVDEKGNEKLPFYFYHSPNCQMSFDEDGRQTYIQWLKSRYDLKELNVRYQSHYTDFKEIELKDVWIMNEEGKGKYRNMIPSEEYRQDSVPLKKYVDNQRFKHEVMDRFFQDLTSEVRKGEPRFYLYSCLTQWNYLYTDWIYTFDRGLELWNMGKHLDSPSFYTLPADSYGDSNAYAVSSEMAMVRDACGEKDFIGGLFFGRYIHNDIYAVHTPSEMIATALASGATDLFLYGYNGLDDGGNFGKWDRPQKESIKRGLNWFSKVREISGKRIPERKAAILFPFATYVLDNPLCRKEEFPAFRNDTLGWYQQFADHGINADVLNPEKLTLEILSPYAYLILPADPLHWAMPFPHLDSILREYVQGGGQVFRSASAVGETAFEIESKSHQADSIRWVEKMVDKSPSFRSFGNGKALAHFMGDNLPAMVEHSIGKGRVLSFGFDYGFAYASKWHLPVPVEYGKDNHYPLQVLRKTPVDQFLEERGASLGRERGIERVRFEKGEVIINHTPYSYTLKQVSKNALSDFEAFDGKVLPGHQSVFIPRA